MTLMQEHHKLEIPSGCHGATCLSFKDCTFPGIVRIPVKCQWPRQFVETSAKCFQMHARQYLLSRYSQYHKLLTGATMHII